MCAELLSPYARRHEEATPLPAARHRPDRARARRLDGAGAALGRHRRPGARAGATSLTWLTVLGAPLVACQGDQALPLRRPTRSRSLADGQGSLWALDRAMAARDGRARLRARHDDAVTRDPARDQARDRRGDSDGKTPGSGACA